MKPAMSELQLNTLRQRYSGPEILDHRSQMVLELIHEIDRLRPIEAQIQAINLETGLNLDAIRAHAIATAFRRCGGNRVAMCQALGVPIRTLQVWMRGLGYPQRARPTQ